MELFEASRPMCGRVDDAELSNETFEQLVCTYRSGDQDSDLSKIKASARELGSVDYLVLTAFLLLSVGISLMRSLSADRSQETGDVHVLREVSDGKPTTSFPSSATERSPEGSTSTMKSLISTFHTAGTIVSPFVNTLCLFSVNGEILASGTGIVFVFVGILLSVLVIFFTGFHSIIRINNIQSISVYLKKRYRGRIVGTFVVGSSIIRQIAGGALNLYIIGVVIPAMTNLSSPVVYIVMLIASVICVSSSGIHTRASSSFGGTFLWLLVSIIFITLCVVTSNLGGLAGLLATSEKLSLPTFYPSPWERNSFWGFLSVGILMGFQIYGLSSVTLGYVATVSSKKMNCSVAISLLYLLLWLLLGTWGGLGTSVTFKAAAIDPHLLSPRSIDGSLAKMVSVQMRSKTGFRGFFIAALIAASMSGLSRRFNQLIGLIYIASKDVKDLVFVPSGAETLPKHILKQPPPNAPDELLKQLQWEEKQRTCCPVFAFKLIVGVGLALLSLSLVWVMHTSNERIWELWVTVIGILNGGVMAAVLMGLLCPCISHFSVVVGILAGWMVPCGLALGHRILFRPTLLNFEDASFFGAIWTDRRDDTPFQGDHVISHNQKNWHQKLFSTSYCFYGAVGFLSCVAVSLILSLITWKCFPISSRTISGELMMPFCRKMVRSLPEVEELSPSVPLTSKTKRRKRQALRLVQETVGV